jgi:bifunctional DNA-binding transcriptional regulator/antitoxin component of YhaV-PrlF toxin-antitoxin module
MDGSDEKIMSNFKVGVIVIPAEDRREHDLEITITIEQRMQL